MHKIRTELLSQQWKVGLGWEGPVERVKDLVWLLLEGGEVDGELGRVVHCLLS